MNSKVNSLKIEDILFFDVECVREHETLDPNSKEFDLFQQKTRNKDTDEFLTEDEVIELYKRKGALYFAHNKIVCITVAVVSQGKIHVKTFKGDQKSIIKKFYASINKDKKTIPAGYNVIAFDFPLIRTKALQEGINSLLPERFNDAGKKPWNFEEVNKNINVLDLMPLMKGTTYTNLTLDESCHLVGIESPKDKIDGSKVSDYYYDGKLDGIATYCEKDTVACVQLFQKMRSEEVITDVVIHKDDDTIEELPVLNDLFINKSFNSDIKEKLKEKILAKRVTKKEWSMLEKMITDLYIENKMFVADSKKVQDQKKEEVKEFIEEIKQIKK